MPELKHYRHRELMDELNKFMIAVKCHHHLQSSPEDVRKEMQEANPIPSVQEIDRFHQQLMEVLQKDSSPMRKY